MENEPPPVEPTPPKPEQAPSQPSTDFISKMAVLFSPLPKVAKMGEGTLSEQDEKFWSMGSHIGGLIGAAWGLGFLPPLVIYLMQKDKSQFVACQAKEALNFQLSYLIIMLVCMIFFWLLFPILLIMVMGIVMLVTGIIAGIKAYDGEFYALPFTLRMIK